MATNYVAFQQLLMKKYRCTRCGDDFSASESGMLLCSFHPLAAAANSKRATPYFEKVPSPCPTCNNQHLMVSIRQAPVRYDTSTGDDGITDYMFVHYDRQRIEVPLQIDDPRDSIGCVAGDHAVSVFELFDQPFVALPFNYYCHLLMSTRYSVEQLRHQRAFDDNWFVIDSADQLVKTLSISMPYTTVAFCRPVMAIYDAMARRFGIEPLVDAARSARVFNDKSSLSTLSHLHHPDAARKDALHKGEKRGVEFAPFIIIVKIAQNFFGSKGIRLI
jgi:hypothetical protein